jgi:ABC-type uncharacterized transport system ATPase subunit
MAAGFVGRHTQARRSHNRTATTELESRREPFTLRELLDLGWLNAIIAIPILVPIAGILLDEPCSALDPISTAKIEETIDELSKDHTIAIVTHNLQQASRVALSDLTLEHCIALWDLRRRGIWIESGYSARNVWPLSAKVRYGWKADV